MFTTYQHNGLNAYIKDWVDFLNKFCNWIIYIAPL